LQNIPIVIYINDFAEGGIQMKKWFTLGLSLITSTAFAITGNITPAHANGHSQTYTINFKGNSLPANAEQIIQEAGGIVLKKDAALAYVKASSSHPQFLSKIQANQEVENAGRQLSITMEKAVAKEIAVTDGDHGYYDQYQWDIKQVTQNGASWNLPGGKGKKDVVVAVIDTGIDLEHPDLKDNIVDAKSFVPGESAQDYEGHGSHVAGAIAANGKALGVGPSLGIAALKVFPRDGSASTATIAEALKYAADKDYDVVNMSLGDYLFLQDPASHASDIRAEMNLFKKAIAYAHKKGVTVVGSAGNAGADITSPGRLTRFFDEENRGATHRDPASNLLIRVSAGNKDKQLTYYSNYGVGKIDVMAPGGDRGPNNNDQTYLCFSTVPIVDENDNVTHGYAWYAGTSMAAPKVAAVAGLVISKHGKNQISPTQVKSIIKQSAEDIYKKGYDKQSGFGLINAVNALNHR
jgi:subtilisin family serine protease